MQVNDRLDRYCCGFTPDPTDMCVENLLHTKCGNTEDLLLVHILVHITNSTNVISTSQITQIKSGPVFTKNLKAKSSSKQVNLGTTPKNTGHVSR